MKSIAHRMSVVTLLGSMLLANAASAHAIEHQRTAAARHTPSIATTDSATPQPARGSFGYELLGGSIGLTLSAGVTYMVWNQPADADGIYANRILTVVGMIPLATALGVYLGGETSDGNGRFLPAWGGAWLGIFAGILVSLPIAPEDSPDDERIPVMVSCVALGMFTGAVLGYRWSADPPATPMITPTLDGRGAMFTLSGVM